MGFLNKILSIFLIIVAMSAAGSILVFSFMQIGSHNNAAVDEDKKITLMLVIKIQYFSTYPLELLY